ncbi:MAG: sensor histidine kinase [Haloarculaceae archaeon]
MTSSARRPVAARLTKRSLGEGYLVGTSAVLASVLVGVLMVERPVALYWLLGGVAAALPIPVVAWLDRLDLDTGQVWYVAECAAFGTGFAAVALVGAEVTAGLLSVSAEQTVVLAALVATTTAVGALVGIARELQRSTQRLSLRNRVLHRILRHNLRNDMTVVLAQLEDVKSRVDEPERETLDAAQRKIQAFVDLTDKARQVDIATTDGESAATALDLAALVGDRIADLREVHPDLSIEADLPDSAWVYAERQFGLVIDNVVESAIVHGGAEPDLHVTCTVEGDRVVLCIADDGGTIPDNDLSAVASGTEDDLNHGYGVELWLVYWLVERNEGSVAVDTDGDSRNIEISLPRAPPDRAERRR